MCLAMLAALLVHIACATVQPIADDHSALRCRVPLIVTSNGGYAEQKDLRGLLLGDNATKAHKLTFLSTEDAITDVQQAAQDALGDAITITASLPGMLEAMPKVRSAARLQACQVAQRPQPFGTGSSAQCTEYEQVCF